jgi:hypothetical protein
VREVEVYLHTYMQGERFLGSPASRARVSSAMVRARGGRRKWGGVRFRQARGGIRKGGGVARGEWGVGNTSPRGELGLPCPCARERERGAKGMTGGSLPSAGQPISNSKFKSVSFRLKTGTAPKIMKFFRELEQNIWRNFPFGANI